MEAAQRAQLFALIRQCGWLMQALELVRAQGLPAWCVGAGVLRNLVWDAAHGYPLLPRAESDIDVAWFDASEAADGQDRALQQRLRDAMPVLRWEVTNQAWVHRWFEGYFGHAVEPLAHLHEAVASWPETATAVAVWLDEQGELQLIAPYGLVDLFDLVVRRNPARVSVQTYQQRVLQKRYTERWPQVRVLPA